MSIVDIILYIGIFVFAMTGALKARAHKMDILGGLVMAFVTAYGGGTIRDLILDKPLGWMNNYLSLGLTLLATFIVFLTKDYIGKLRRTIFITDAIGIAMFTIGGIERSLEFGANSVYALLLGVISATFGGLIADIISNEVPALLKSGEMYATTCAIGGVVYIVFLKIPFNKDISLIICVAIIVALRIFTMKKKWYLPSM